MSMDRWFSMSSCQSAHISLLPATIKYKCVRGQTKTLTWSFQGVPLMQLQLSPSSHRIRRRFELSLNWNLTAAWASILSLHDLTISTMIVFGPKTNSFRNVKIEQDWSQIAEESHDQSIFGDESISKLSDGEASNLRASFPHVWMMLKCHSIKFLVGWPQFWLDVHRGKMT